MLLKFIFSVKRPIQFNRLIKHLQDLIILLLHKVVRTFS